MKNNLAPRRWEMFLLASISQNLPSLPLARSWWFTNQPHRKKQLLFSRDVFCFVNSNWSKHTDTDSQQDNTTRSAPVPTQSLSFPHGSMRLITYCWIRATASWRAAGFLVATTCRWNAQPWNRARWPISWVEDARGLPKQVIFMKFFQFTFNDWMMFPSFQSKKILTDFVAKCLSCCFIPLVFAVLFLSCDLQWDSNSFNPSRGGERIWANLWKDLGKKKKLSKNILPLSPQKSTKKTCYQTTCFY